MARRVEVSESGGIYACDQNHSLGVYRWMFGNVRRCRIACTHDVDQPTIFGATAAHALTRWITSDGSKVGPLVYTDVLYVHVVGECESFKVDALEIVGHSWKANEVSIRRIGVPSSIGDDTHQS